MLAAQEEEARGAPCKNEAYWREEVVANTVPSILGNEAMMKSFVAKMTGSDAATRNAFVEFLDVISDFLKNAFDKLKNKLA